jgi:hypothetical protein
MWQRMDARLTPCLDLNLICGVPGLPRTDTFNTKFLTSHPFFYLVLCYLRAFVLQMAG